MITGMMEPQSDQRPLPPIHGVDVRIRLLIALATSIAVLWLSHPIALGILCLISAGYMLMLRRFRLQLICYIFLVAFAGLSVLFLLLLQMFIPMMRSAGPSQLLTPFLRMLAMLHVVMPLAMSIRLRDMLAFMKRLRFPRVLYLPLAVTIRFIPGVVYDIRQIRDCLRLRGYRGWNLLRPRLWLLPMVFRCLHLSDELAIAAELKGVGYGRPAHPKSASLIRGPNIAAVMVLAITLVLAFGVNLSLPSIEPAGHHHSKQKTQHSADSTSAENQIAERSSHAAS